MVKDRYPHFNPVQEQQGKDVFEYDIYGCPAELKGQLKIGDFSEKD